MKVKKTYLSSDHFSKLYFKGSNAGASLLNSKNCIYCHSLKHFIRSILSRERAIRKRESDFNRKKDLTQLLTSYLTNIIVCVLNRQHFKMISGIRRAHLLYSGEQSPRAVHGGIRRNSEQNMRVRAKGKFAMK